MPCLACIDMTIYWHGKAWLSLLILFAYFFLFAFFQKLNDLLRRMLIRFLFSLRSNDLLRRMLSKFATKVLLFDGIGNPQLRVGTQQQLRTFIAEILIFV